MGLIYSRSFDRFSDNNLFLPLDDEPTEFERQLRFTYAARSLLRHLGNTYSKSNLDIPQRKLPPQSLDFSLWYSKKGSIVTTETISGPINIVWERIFVKDPLYKTFGKVLGLPLHAVNLSLESAMDSRADFMKLVDIYERACSDSEWKNHLPRMLIEKKANIMNGS